MKDTKPRWEKESTELLLSRLKQIQDEEGYCPEHRLNDLARELEMAPSHVYSVATFYSFLDVRPEGEHVIRICNSPSCFVNGSEQILQALEREMDVKVGETTTDGRYRLERTSCIGCCDECPSALVDGKPVTRLSVNSIPELLKSHHRANRS